MKKKKKQACETTKQKTESAGFGFSRGASMVNPGNRSQSSKWSRGNNTEPLPADQLPEDELETNDGSLKNIAGYIIKGR